MRHEIERADGSREVSESRTAERVALATIGGTTLVAIGALALSFVGGGFGSSIAILSGGGGAAGTADYEYAAPSTPTITATVYRDQGDSLWISGGTFSGDADDTHDSTSIQVDTAGGNFSSPQYADLTLGAVERDTIAADSGAVVDIIMQYKGASGGWSAPDTLTGVEMVKVTSSVYDPYLPAAWTDTVHYEDFTSLASGSDLSEIVQTIGSFSVQAWGGECTGGAGPSGYGGTPCRAQDSVVFANQASAPWVWEAIVPDLSPDSSAGVLTYNIDFADGNGDAAAANLTRLYLRFSIYFEEDGTGVGANDYVFNDGSNKWYNFNGVSNGFLLGGWDGGQTVFVGQTSPSSSTCDEVYGLEANTWTEYAGNAGDTVNTIPGVPECSGVGIGGWLKRGVWQHHFVCMDFSPSAGSRVISWGMYSEDEQGVAGYHNNVTNYNRVGVGTDTDFDNWLWNGTYGGSKWKGPGDMSYWFDDILIMTGSSGSCVTPPSFS